MQKLDLQRLMRDAKEDSKAIVKMTGDWRTQLQMLNRTVSVVTTYQKAIHRAFVTPAGHKKGNRNWFELPEGVVAIEELAELESLQFKGACLVQTLEVVHHGESHAFGTTVRYKAVLKLDENYFLMQMLPQVKNLRNADPDYTIYDLSIDVPKGELVAESLKMLNDKLAEEPKEPAGPRSPSPFEGFGRGGSSTGGDDRLVSPLKVPPALEGADVRFVFGTPLPSPVSLFGASSPQANLAAEAAFGTPGGQNTSSSTWASPVRDLSDLY